MNKETSSCYSSTISIRIRIIMLTLLMLKICFESDHHDELSFNLILMLFYVMRLFACPQVYLSSIHNFFNILFCFMFCAVFIGVACDVAVSFVASVGNNVDVDADRTLESVQRHLAAIFLTIQWFFRAADFVVLLFIELLLLPQQSESASESHRMMLHLLPIAGKPKFLSSFWRASPTQPPF